MKRNVTNLWFLLFLMLFLSVVVSADSIYKDILNQTIENIVEEDSFITLNEGTTRTFKIDNEEFKVNLMMISEKDGSVIIKIDSESLPRMKEGDLQASSKGIIVGLVKTFVTSKKNRPSIAKFVISKKGKSAREVKEDKSDELKINYAEENESIPIKQETAANVTIKNILQPVTEMKPSTINHTQTPISQEIQTTEQLSQKAPSQKVVPTKSFWKKVVDFFSSMF